jgi:hypothetical protein
VKEVEKTLPEDKFFSDLLFVVMHMGMYIFP